MMVLASPRLNLVVESYWSIERILVKLTVCHWSICWLIWNWNLSELLPSYLRIQTLEKEIVEV